MAFQGFAREEQFSTNQIKIDIASVIDNDLAEANRMSKFMAKNAQMGEKWRGMYFDALVSKHKVEEDNRRRNFQFFMENRDKIQKQIEYNNKIKAEDAARSHPHIPTFMEMLQPALMQMAVDVGAKGIQKLFQDAAVAKKEAAAKHKTQTIQTMSGLIAGGASKEQLELIKSGHFKDHSKHSLELQKERLDYFNSLGDYQAGAESVALIHATNGLKTIDRQIAANNPQITANNFNELARNFVSHQNGSEVSFHDLPFVNQASFDTYTDDVTNAYIESISEDGLPVAPVLYSVQDSIGKVVNQWRSRHDTQQYRQAVVDIDEQVIHAIDRAQTPQEVLEVLTDPNGTFQSTKGGGPAAGMKFYFDRVAPYQTANQLLGVYHAKGFQGKSMADEPTTNRSRRMQEAIRQAHNREAQSWESQEQQKSNLANQLAAEISSGEVYGPDRLNSWVNNLQHGTNTEFGKMLAGMKPVDRSKITTALMVATGRDPNVQAVSTEVSTVDKAFSKGDKDKLATSVALSTLVGAQKASIPLVKAALDDNPHKFRSVIDSWLSGIQERDDPHGEWNETQLANHIQAIISKKGDDYKQLQSIFEPVVTEIDQETGQEVPAKVAYFPEVEKSIQNNAPKATGMSQVMAHSRNSSVQAARRKITKDQTVIEALTPFMMDLHNAQKAGADLRPILNRTPKVLTYLGSRSGKTGDSTQWINYFIEDHFTHMKPLSGDDLLTPEEAAEANSRWTGYNRMGNSMRQFVQGGHTYIPSPRIARYQTPASSATPASSSVSHIGSGLHAVGMPTSLGGGQNGTWTDPNHEDHFDLKWNQDGQAQWMYDYFKLHNIVMTEVKGRGNGITVPHSTVGNFTHGSGHGGDVPLDSRNGLGGGAVGMEADHIFRDKLFTRLKSGGDHFNKGLTPQEAYEFDLYGGRTYPARSFR